MKNYPDQRYFVVINGNVMTSGRSLDLVKGQFGIFDMGDLDAKGMGAVADFQGKPKNTLYQMRLGIGDRPVGRSQDDHSYSSVPFKVTDVFSIGKKEPDFKETKGDKVVLGYNGINDDTAIKMFPGEHYVVRLRLEGQSVENLGFEDGIVEVQSYIAVEDCDTSNCVDCDACSEANIYDKIKALIEDLKNQPLVSNVKVADLVDIKPVRSCQTTPTINTTDYRFYTLRVADTGGANALAIVRAQYPGKIVERIGREGAYSVYQLIQPASDAAPSAFENKLPDLIKGCNTCPAGYTEKQGGYIYRLAIEDEGTDKTSEIETSFPHVIAGTVSKLDEQDGGTGFYTLMTSQELTEEEIANYVDSHPTAVVDYVGEAKDMCLAPAGTTVDWVAGDTCQVGNIDFYLDLPDDECGNDRLEELNQHYPYTVTLVDGVSGGCKHRYKMTVPSELVCDECDPIFKDYFNVETPEPYEGFEWQMDEGAYSNCKLGILFEGKVQKISPPKHLIDAVPYIEEGIKLQVSGGYVEDITYGDHTVTKPWHVEYLQNAVKRDNLGADFLVRELEGRAYFGGENKTDVMQRWLNNDELNIEPTKQYVDYQVSIKRGVFAGHLGNKHNDFITYHILVEVGRDDKLKLLLDNLAVAAGLV